MFLQQLLSWWNIVNVKKPFQRIAHRQQDGNPIYQNSSLDQNLMYLKKICEWLDVWETLNNSDNKGQGRAEKLSNETHFALRHTASTVI